MLRLPTAPRHVIGPLLVLLVSAILFLLQPWLHDSLAFYRPAVNQGEWWRLLSANFLHTNFYHLILNAAGLILLWALHGDHFGWRQYLLVMLVCCIGSTLGVWWFAPELVWYVGLSGALHGVFVVGAGIDIRKGMLSGWLLLAGVLVKIVYESVFGGNPEVAAMINAKVATQAHLYGVATGLLWLAVTTGYRKIR